MAILRLATLAFVIFQSFSWTVFANVVPASSTFTTEQKTFGPKTDQQAVSDAFKAADQKALDSASYKTTDQIGKEAVDYVQKNCDTEFWCPGDYDRAVAEQAASNSPTSDCQYSEGASVSEMLDGCKPNGVITASNYSYAWGAKERIIEIANQIIIVGSLLSIGAIVYAGFLYVTSMGDDERIKTGKNSLKFGIIGFIVMLISFPLVNAIVRLFYEIGG